jgi:hypothetical protein
MKRLVLQVTFVLTLLMSNVSQGALITFDLLWDGTSFGNTAMASGFITFDESFLPNPGTLLFVPLPDPSLVDVSITVSGAAAGNGTFGLADFANLLWQTGPAVDLGSELVGQPGFGDFNLITAGAPAPTGVATFTLAANVNGDRMLLASMSPRNAIPEPSSFVAWASLGFVAYGWRRRKRKLSQV